MTLPTLTWTQGASQAGSGAMTAVQVMTLIRTTIIADAGLWEVKSSDLVGAYPYLELGLAGSPPSGNDLDTARLLLFGGATHQVPFNAEDPIAIDSALSTTIFGYLVLNPSGAVGDWRTTDPYASATRKLKGRGFMRVMPTGGTPYVYTIQSSEGILIVVNLGSTSGCSSLLCGRLIEQNSTPVWMLGMSNAALTGFLSTASTAITSSAPIGSLTEASDQAQARALIGTVPYTVGRIFTDITPTAVGLSNSALGFNLHSILLGGRVRGSIAPYEFFGVMRQIRYGASTSDRAKIYSGATLQAFAFGPTVTASTTNHLYVDQQA